MFAEKGFQITRVGIACKKCGSFRNSVMHCPVCHSVANIGCILCDNVQDFNDFGCMGCKELKQIKE